MKHHIWFWLLYPWALPQTLIGLLLALAYRPRAWRWSDGCLEAIGGDRIWGKPDAQSHGFIIYYRDELCQRQHSLRVHERVHVIQGLIGGPFYALAYGGTFLFWFASQCFRDWQRAYTRIPFEITAYRVQKEYDQGGRSYAWGGSPFPAGVQRGLFEGRPWHR